MSDSYISYGSDGSYHIIRPIGEGFDIETAFLIALVIVAIRHVALFTKGSLE